MATHLARRGALAGLRLRRLGYWNRVVAHRGWLAVRDAALVGLAIKPAVVVVAGAPGIGKTFLLQELGRVLRAGGISAVPVLGGQELPDWDSLDPKTVLLVDDAGRFDDAALVALTQHSSRLVVLAERSGLAARIANLPPATDTVATPRYLELPALRASEVGGFLAASLGPAVRPEDRFAEAAIARVAARSGGVPRLLHELAGTAMFLAERERAERVEARHVDQVALVGETGVHTRVAAQEVAELHRPRQRVEVGTPLAMPVEAPADIPSQLGGSRGGPRWSWRLLGAAAAAAAVLAATAFRLLSPVSSSPVPASLLRPAEQTVVAPRAPDRIVVPKSTVVHSAVPVTAPAIPAPAIPAPAIPAPAMPAQAMPAPTAVGRLSLPGPPLAQDGGGAGPNLPAGAWTVVNIDYPAGNARAAQRATELAHGLRQEGFIVDEPVAASAREPSGTHFVFAEDRDAALEVAAAAHRHEAGLAASATRQRPADRAVPPRPGAVLITVSGEGDSS